MLPLWPQLKTLRLVPGLPCHHQWQKLRLVCQVTVGPSQAEKDKMSNNARSNLVPPFTLWCYGKGMFLPNTAFPKGLSKAHYNYTPSWERHRCTEVQNKEEAVLYKYVIDNWKLKCNVCRREDLHHTSFNRNQRGSGANLVGPSGVRVCKDCWKLHDQAQTGVNIPVGQPTKQDDEEQERLLRAKCKDKLILETDVLQPPP